MAQIEQLKLQDHLVLIGGRFEDTVFPLAKGKLFSLAHVDCDIYQSVRFVLSALHDSLEPGCYVASDDPTYSSCLGAMEAVEETYIQERHLLAEQVYPHLVYRPKGISVTRSRGKVWRDEHVACQAAEAGLQ